jgi:(2R)-3-sulfolactate dehydrogenase (NADP+)
MADVTLSLDEIEAMALAALLAAGAGPTQAKAMAGAVRGAEADGIRSHGLPYVPIYAEHVQCGKVDGKAEPTLSHPRPGALLVDAKTGFAHPAIDAGFPALIEAARANGVAVLTIRNSYNCGVLGHHVERLAKSGMLAIGNTNAPASIAPFGGIKPVIGTNPMAMAAPDGAGGAAFVIDQSASVVAKSEVMGHARDGKPIPEGWALDAEGNPTTDPKAALDGGTMAPSGGYKGFGMGLMVETMAAALAGATLGKDASPFSGTKGGPPMTGQAFIAIDPGAYSDVFSDRIKDLTEAILAQPGTRLPGARRAANRERIARGGVVADSALVEKIRALAG